MSNLYYYFYTRGRHENLKVIPQVTDIGNRFSADRRGGTSVSAGGLRVTDRRREGGVNGELHAAAMRRDGHERAVSAVSAQGANAVQTARWRE